MGVVNFCPRCGTVCINQVLTYCNYCKTKMVDTDIPDIELAQNDTSREATTKMTREKYIFVHPDFDKELFERREEEQARNLEENRRRYREEKNNLCCPKCGSTQISANKKGFGLGKAIVGGVAFGGIGLLGGFIGSRKVELTCLNCSHRFKPGDK